MNKDKLKKSLNHRVYLRPVAKRIDGNRSLPQIDDEWIIQKVYDVVELSNTRTGHVAVLGFDHIHHYISNPKRENDGLKHGFLELNVQITLSGNRVIIEPKITKN